MIVVIGVIRLMVFISGEFKLEAFGFVEEYTLFRVGEVSENMY